MLTIDKSNNITLTRGDTLLNYILTERHTERKTLHGLTTFRTITCLMYR